jgi:hypothetical protein
MDPTVSVWSELESYLPAIFPRSVKKNTLNEVVVDFKLCNSVSSHGGCLFLIRLLKTGNKYAVGKTLRTVRPDTLTILNKLRFFEYLGFPYHSDDTPSDQQLSLAFDSNSTPFSLYHREPKSRSHFPILRIAFSGASNRRDAADDFIGMLAKQLNPYAHAYNLHAQHLLLIIWEIARNAADHSASDAYFGLDVYQYHDGTADLVFAFGDLGVGLFENVCRYNERFAQRSRFKERGLCEVYNWALSLGTTTRPTSDVNHGFGMSLISKGAKAIDLALSVFDAQSCGSLGNLSDLTIRELRHSFRDVGFRVGFSYYGRLKMLPAP